LLLEDMDFLLRELLFSPKCWPDWASIPISMAFGVTAAAWVGLGRRWEAGKKGTVALPQGDSPLFSLPRLELLAQRVTRYTLFLILSPYAVSKVLRTQFRVPYVMLDTPLGDVNGFMLAWRFFGYSHGHEVFVAIAIRDSRPAPMTGDWTVESSEAKPAVPWRTVYFERGLKDSYPGSIRREAGAKPERFRYEFDAASRHLRMTFLNSASPAKS